MGITMIKFSKEEVQYFIDTIKEALQDEFDDQDLREGLLESKKILVANIKGVSKGGSVLLTPLETSFISRSCVDSMDDEFMDLGIKEELAIASQLVINHLSNNNFRVAV